MNFTSILKDLVSKIFDQWIKPIVALLLCVTCLSLPLPTLYGQEKNANNKTTEESKDHSPPAFQFTVAILAALLILAVLCKPSRKLMSE